MSDKLGDPDDENGRDQAVDGAKPRYALTDKPRTLLTNKIVDQVRKNRDPEKGEDHPFHLLKLHRFTHISLEVPRFSVDPGGFLLDLQGRTIEAILGGGVFGSSGARRSGLRIHCVTCLINCNKRSGNIPRRTEMIPHKTNGTTMKFDGSRIGPSCSPRPECPPWVPAAAAPRLWGTGWSVP